jgi:predicted Zn-dependent protease
MICTRDPFRTLIASGFGLALFLTGCGGEVVTQPSADAGAVNRARLAALLADAERATAQGQLANAGRKLDEAYVVAPDSPDLWVAIARLRFRGGEHLTSLEAADKALALGPDHAPALLLRALMVRDSHGFAAAKPWFVAALAADPDSPDAWAEYAAALGDGGDHAAMLDAVRRLAEIAPEDPRAPYLQAVLAARGGENTLARNRLIRSGMAERGMASAMLLDAVLSLAEGNPDSAAVTLEMLVARQPANPVLHELLAHALLVGGREVELVKRFGAEAARPESSGYLLMLVARAHERLGERVKAAPLLARAYGMAAQQPVVLAERPGLPEPTANMRIMAEAGNWTEIRAAANVLRSRFPGSLDVAILAGDAALGAGDPRSALEAYALAARVRRPWTLTAKAVHAYRLIGDDAAAETLLARQVAGEPEGIRGLVALARQRSKGGDWQRAAQLLDHVIVRGGGHDLAVLKLRLQAARMLGNKEDTERFARLLANVRPRALRGA